MLIAQPQFQLILLIYLAGFLLQRSKTVPANFAKSLNFVVISIALPAMVLTKAPKLFTDIQKIAHWWLPVAMAWISFFIAWILVESFSAHFKWSRMQKGALIMTMGLGNTSFVGFPLLESLLGPESVSIGILADQPGAFLVLSTLGITVATLYSQNSKYSFKAMLWRVFSFPPFIALVVSLVFALTGNNSIFFLDATFNRISQILIPLALLSVGFQTRFNFEDLRASRTAVGFGLFAKLALIPALFYFSIKWSLGDFDQVAQVTILESAMATQITGALIASDMGLDSEIANLMVSLSIPLSLITVPLWSLLVN